MKMAIEFFSLIVVVAMSCMLFSSMISVSMQNAEARDYYNIVRNRIEDSNCSAEVMKECKAEATSKGYSLEITDVTLYEENPSKLIRMRYSVSIPIYKMLNKKGEKQALLEGYAR